MSYIIIFEQIIDGSIPLGYYCAAAVRLEYRFAAYGWKADLCGHAYSVHARGTLKSNLHQEQLTVEEFEELSYKTEAVNHNSSGNRDD